MSKLQAGMSLKRNAAEKYMALCCVCIYLYTHNAGTMRAQSVYNAYSTSAQHDLGAGAVKRVGRCDAYATEFDLEAEEYVPLPKVSALIFLPVPMQPFVLRMLGLYVGVKYGRSRAVLH